MGYSDSAGLSDGFQKISLSVSAQGKIVTRLRGANTPTPTLPLPVPVTLQLQAAHRPCWEATFTAADVATNGPTTFSASFK